MSTVQHNIYKIQKLTEAAILQSRIQSPELQYLENTQPAPLQYPVSPETNVNMAKKTEYSSCRSNSIKTNAGTVYS